MPRPDGLQRGGRGPEISLELLGLLQNHQKSGEWHLDHRVVFRVVEYARSGIFSFVSSFHDQHFCLDFEF